jgi:hypothetical protein
MMFLRESEPPSLDDVLAEHSEGPVRQIGVDKLALAPGGTRP